jgi:hypothetical protein
MNGHYQEILGAGGQISTDRKQHIIVLLTRMIHQRLIMSQTDNKESTARKGLERGMHLRDDARQ